MWSCIFEFVTTDRAYVKKPCRSQWNWNRRNKPKLTDLKQIHCALNEAPECHFQCGTEEQLKKHIEDKHRSKTQLPCTVCNLSFRDLDDLSRHMSMAHKSQDSIFIKCNHCEKALKDKTELKYHISSHWSYKPCTKYQTDNCNTRPCRFNNTKLNAGQ